MRGRSWFISDIDAIDASHMTCTYHVSDKLKVIVMGNSYDILGW